MRGRYRILLDMAAGVGKTYRMLQEGRLAAAEGRDVVIGYLEPHDRPDTSVLADGLESVPRLTMQIGGTQLGELDLDAILARAPELALVDELAHTNAAGMRHEKRYQDIETLLEAGIDVISTVNVQHLESLNDEVAELTGVRVRETFPDSILEDADEVVLVDLSPETLQDRIRAGKVYPVGQVESALANFFRADRLSALRELALREVAEGVEARRLGTALDPMSAAAVHERILALVTPDARSQRIVRRAFRSAERLGAELDVVFIRVGQGRLTASEEVSLAALRRLVVILGGRFVEEEGDRFVETVQRVVRERGATYVIIGTPREGRARDLLRGSLVGALIRALPGVDLRIVANRAERPVDR